MSISRCLMKSVGQQKRTIAILVLIILIGLALRFSVFLKELHDFSNITGDAKNYVNMSQQIVDDGIYGYGLGHKSGVSNAYVTPGYPLFLSMVYALIHNTYRQITLVRMLQVLIGAIFIPLLAFLWVRRLFGRDSIALLTAFFTAIYPTYILSAVYVLTESCSLAAMLLYFYFQTLALQERKPYLNILSGVAFALNILIRPTMLPLFILPFISAYFTTFKSDRKLLIRLFAITAAAFAAVMLPWWVRNILVLHKLILLSSGSGDPLLAGTYPYMTDLFKDYLAAKVKSSESAYAKKRIIEGFSSQPLLYLKWYTIGKMQFLFRDPWLWKTPPYNTALGDQLMRYTHKMFKYLGVLGSCVGMLIKRIFININIYALLMLGLLLIFIPVNRYAYHLMFFLMTASAFIIIYFADFLRKMYTRIRMVYEDGNIK